MGILSWFVLLTLVLILMLKGKKGCLFILGLFIILLITLSLIQDKIIYMPSFPGIPFTHIATYHQLPSQNAYIFQHPSHHNLKTQNITILTSDNVALRGWDMQNKKTKSLRTIVMFHQNTGNIGLQLVFVKHIVDLLNARVILVAYRGYSESSGVPTQAGLKIDAESIINYAIQTSKVSKLNIFVYGKSLGGAVATYAAANPFIYNYIDGLILQNTFTSIPDLVNSLFPWIRPFKNFILTSKWDTINQITHVQCPILFIKCNGDDLVPVAHMHKLMEKANSSSFTREYSVPGGTHNRGWDLDTDNYFKQVQQFIVDVQNNKLKRITQQHNEQKQFQQKQKQFLQEQGQMQTQKVVQNQDL